MGLVSGRLPPSEHLATCLHNRCAGERRPPVPVGAACEAINQSLEMERILLAGGRASVTDQLSGDGVGILASRVG